MTWEAILVLGFACLRRLSTLSFPAGQLHRNKSKSVLVSTWFFGRLVRDHAILSSTSISDAPLCREQRILAQVANSLCRSAHRHCFLHASLRRTARCACGCAQPDRPVKKVTFGQAAHGPILHTTQIGPCCHPVRHSGDSPLDPAIHTFQEAEVPSSPPVRGEPALGGGVGVGSRLRGTVTLLLPVLCKPDLVPENRVE